jgi:hypothetical protein
LKNISDLLNATDEEKEELTDGEVQQAALNFVSEYLSKAGHTVLGLERLEDGLVGVTFQMGGENAFCFVQSKRYPESPEPMQSKPSTVPDGLRFYWFGVTFANELEAFDPESEGGLPLMKGFGLLPLLRQGEQLIEL